MSKVNQLFMDQCQKVEDDLFRGKITQSIFYRRLRELNVCQHIIEETYSAIVDEAVKIQRDSK
jgi:hypothetical protein